MHEGIRKSGSLNKFVHSMPDGCLEKYADALAICRDELDDWKVTWKEEKEEKKEQILHFGKDLFVKLKFRYGKAIWRRIKFRRPLKEKKKKEKK
jgi:hypothetical protein